MNCTKKLVVALMMQAGRLMANIYQGTIGETVTETNNPGYYVGEVLSGRYQYESDDIDGKFVAPNVAGYSDGVKTLDISIFDFSSGRWLDAHDSDFRLYLLVEGGIVTDFHFDGESGTTDFWFYFDHFLNTKGNSWGAADPRPRTYTTKGTLSFGGPVVESGEPIAEVGNTAALLATGLAVSLVIKKRRRRTFT